MYVLNRTRNIDNFKQLLVFSVKVLNWKHYRTYRLVSFDCKVKWNINHIDQQECIPVGCVPSASVAITRCQYWGGVPSGGGVCSFPGGVTSGGVPSRDVYLPGGCTFRGVYQAYPPPSWNGPGSGTPPRRNLGPCISTLPEGTWDQAYPTPLWTEWQTHVKTLPSRSFIGGR